MEEKADPQLKASMLEAVDNQIQGNDPPEVGVAFKRLVNPLSPPSAPVQNPLSPQSAPAQRRLQSPPAKRNSLAVRTRFSRKWDDAIKLAPDSHT